MSRIVVCGGSFIGLSTAMMLARDGHEVTVLEADPAPVPDRPLRAWDTWARPGVPQLRQPHNLFSRAREVLDTELPGITDSLIEAGCVWVDPLSWMPPFMTDRSARPGDDRFPFATGRRPVLEAVVARAAAAHTGVTVRRGVVVESLGVAPNGTGLPRGTGVPTRRGVGGGVPQVTGVRLGGGEELHADLVVDAMGRRSPLVGWLTDLGATPPRLESEDSGFVYYTRYFTGPEPPALIGPAMMELGSMSVLTLQGDNDTWSVTVFTASADRALHPLRDVDRFSRVVRACPLQAHWLDGEAISDIHVMAGILDRHRRFVVDDRPVATGVAAVGDAWACTNPSHGRGLSVGLLHARHLRDAIREVSGDPAADPEGLVRRFDATTEAEVAPFVRNQITTDRARIAAMTADREGTEPPEPDPGRVALGAAMLADADVFRAVMETVTCLALPQEVFARPDISRRIAAHAGASPMTMPGPDRAQLLELVG